jgi:hypothetical protein
MDSRDGTGEQLVAAIGRQVASLGSSGPVGRIRSGLRPLPDELDQLARLTRFRTAHPEVIVGDGGFGTMQARIPELDGETVITRYTLRELLDKLDELRP